ncbi:hypothetical protein GPECTOR_28g762 [Gonium pectorale]|uniref:Myb-like domain-containing protein n=1 Tax=Gonium pectorale TaxID=33097 RepID=A0A150GFJ5_GONPE|nr:hypothetical protein GPECTOR_28g762 [Gonium pectorale]|eukprot:KXZ48355.1 hypothetical protein GPECTOR_28g762 [Gonium pectorale]
MEDTFDDDAGREPGEGPFGQAADAADDIFSLDTAFDSTTRKPILFHDMYDQADASLMAAAEKAGNTMTIHVLFGDSIPSRPGVKRFCRLYLPCTSTVVRAKRDLCRLLGRAVYPSFMRLSLLDGGGPMQDADNLHKYDVRHGSFVQLDITSEGDIFEALRRQVEPLAAPVVVLEMMRRKAAQQAAANGAGGEAAAQEAPAAAAVAAPAEAAAGEAAAAAGVAAGGAAVPVTAVSAGTSAETGAGTRTSNEAAAAAPAAAAAAPAAPAGAARQSPRQARPAPAAPSPPAKRQRQEPSGQGAGAAAAGAPARGQLRSPSPMTLVGEGHSRKLWSRGATIALLRGMLEYGSSWRSILDDSRFGPTIGNREGLQLKDRWTNLNKAAARDFTGSKHGLSKDTELQDLIREVVSSLQ